jgi:hypothetical protein
MLPPLLDASEIRARLQIIFPEGTPERTRCTSLAAARTVFTMLYVGAVEGGEWLAPKFVYRMGDTQSGKRMDRDRIAYLAAVKKPGTPEPRDRWYRENTRESIRDETLRFGLAPIGAVIVRSDVPTTSSKGRYALPADLAALFDPALTAAQFEAAADAWRRSHLTPSALAAVKVLQIAAAGAKAKVSVTLPSREGRVLAPGLSSVIAKALIEVFAPRFLTNPAVLWLSESSRKVVEKDDEFLRQLGIKIEPEKLLPDVILADSSGGKLLFVFAEIVATDGPINEGRRSDLLKIVIDAGFTSDQTFFITAFQSRDHPAFKKTIASLAWGSFAWCFSEPEHLIAFDGPAAGAIRKLRDFLNRG